MRIEDLLIRQKGYSKVALECAGKTLTYCQWNALAFGISQHIAKIVGCNHRNVAIFLPNSINYAVAYFAILFSDNVIVPIGIQAKTDEIKSTLEYCEIDLIITDEKNYECLFAFLSDYKYRVTILNIDTEEDLTIHPEISPIVKTESLVFDGKENDVAIMLHTSGTTSKPKRVMLTHKNLICNIESNVKSLNLLNEDICLLALPMFFGYCNTAQFLSHIYVGASMIIYDGVFLPKHFWEIVQEKKVTNFTAVPTMLMMLLSYRYTDNYDVSSMRFICFGGGKMSVEKLEEIIGRFPHIGFIQTYGQTECAPRVTALLPNDALKKIGSVGKPIPDVSLRICTDEGKIAKAFEKGEILVKGDNVMKGYYKRNEITKRVKKNSWLYTGDIGYLDNDGYLFLVGRKKNIIISGGINIYPEEIEQMLMNFPEVKETYVYGIEHEVLGEIPVAKIVVKENQSIDINEVIKFCKQKLAAYKVPKKIVIVDSIEKTYNGKIKRIIDKVV